LFTNYENIVKKPLKLFGFKTPPSKANTVYFHFKNNFLWWKSIIISIYHICNIAFKWGYSCLYFDKKYKCVYFMVNYTNYYLKINVKTDHQWCSLQSQLAMASLLMEFNKLDVRFYPVPVGNFDLVSTKMGNCYYVVHNNQYIIPVYWYRQIIKLISEKFCLKAMSKIIECGGNISTRATFSTLIFVSRFAFKFVDLINVNM